MTSEDISKDSLKRFQEAKKEFDSYMQGVDAKSVFCCYAMNQIVKKIEGSGIPKHIAVERAAMWLFPLFEHEGDSSDEAIDSAIKVLENCQQTFVAHRMFHPDKLQCDELETSLWNHTENVRGSAYFFQLVNKIDVLFSPYDQTLSNKFGLGPLKAVQIAKALGEQLEENINGFKAEFNKLNGEINGKLTQNPQGEMTTENLVVMNKLINHLECMKGDWVPSRRQIEQKLGNITEREWDALKYIFGLTPNNISSVTDLKNLQDRPVYFVSKDKLFITQATILLDAIFAHYDEYLRNSESLQNQYGQTVSTWMEDSIHSFMLRFFPEECVLKNACFFDQSTPSSNRETDCLIKWGPIVIILEAKGKKIDRDTIRLSKPGLRNILRKNIEDSFSQSNKVVKVLSTGKVIKFKEKCSDKTMSIDGNKVIRIMSISVTLQHLYGVCTQLAVTQRINLFKDNTFPWSVSIDDLEVITEFLETPEVFLYYIKRRTAHQGMGISLSADELDLLGHYMDNRLHPSYYEQREEILKNTNSNSKIRITGGEERFDSYYTSVCYGERKEDLEKPYMNLPLLIFEILEYLRNRANDDSKWIAFALLGLSNYELEAVVEDFKRIRSYPRPTIGFNRKTLKFKDLIIVIMSYDSLPDETVSKQLIARPAIEKYRAKSKTAVTLAFDLSRPDVITFASWQEMPWKYDQAFENIIEEEKTKQRILRANKANGKIRRNDPCPCGSGMKFKKCCIDFIKIEYIK